MTTRRYQEPYNLYIKRGRVFEQQFQPVEDDGTTVIPLTGYTAVCEIRAYSGDNAPLIVAATCTVNTDEHYVTVSLTATQTTDMHSGGVYDIKLIDVHGVAYDFISGKAILSERVTQ